ncbi:translocation/assembly module TamB domain-containing protein [Niveibacterium terrae]|uniref:translocation/assembly module TamB domain-containing protein n=1 Tax=Niveibacterium terrae TaxID=3373598 RepID=UPI003A958A90
MSEEAPREKPEKPAPQRFWSRLAGRVARRPVAMLLGLAAALLPWVGLAWLVETPSGLVALAESLNVLGRGDLRIEGVSGRLRDRFALERFHLEIGLTRVEIRDLAVDWQLSGLLRGVLHCRSLAASSLEVGHQASGKPPSIPKSFALPFELHVERAKLGRFDFSSDLDAHNHVRLFGFSALEARAVFARHRWLIQSLSGQTDWGPASLSGSLVPDPPFAIAANGRIRVRYGARELPARVTANGSLVDLDLAGDGRSDLFKLRGRLRLKSFAAQTLVGLDLDADSFDPQRLNPASPRAQLALKAQLAPLRPRRGLPEAAAKSGLRIGGPVTVLNSEAGTLDSGRLPVERLTTDLAWDGSRVELGKVDLRVPGGGTMAGRLAWRRAGQPDAWGMLEADLVLAGLDPSRLHSRLPSARLAGQIVAEAGRDSQKAHVDVGDGKLRLAADLVRRGSRLELSALRLASGSAELGGSGSLSLDATRRFSVELQASRFDPHAFWAASPVGSLSGRLSAQGRLAPKLALDGSFELADSRFAGLPVGGEGAVSLADGHLRRTRFTLDALGNRISAEGAFGRSGEKLAFRIDAPALSRLGAGFDGRLTGTGSLSGSLDHFAGDIDLRGDKLAVPGGHRLDAINLRARLPEGRASPFSLQFALAGYRAPGEPDAKLRRATLSAQGLRSDHVLKLELELPRRYALHAEARGGLGQALAWSGKLKRLGLEAGGELHLVAPADLAFGPDHLRLGAATLRGEKTEISSELLSWTAREILARGHLSGAEIRPGAIDPLRVRTRRIALQFGAEWDLQLAEHANGHVRVFREGGDVVVGDDSPVALGLSELDASASVKDDSLSVRASALGLRSGRFTASLSARLMRVGLLWRLAPDEALQGRAQIAIPRVDWLGPLIDANLRTTGSISGDFAVNGTPAHPLASGSAQGENLGLVMVDQGLRVSGGRLRLRFDADRAYLDELSFVSPTRVRPDEKRIDFKALTAQPGRASASGQIELASGRGLFRIDADRLAMLQRRDRWLLISGQGQIESTWKSMTLTGRFTVPAGFIGFARKGLPTLDDDVVVRGRTQSGEQRFRIATDLEVDLGQALYLKAFGVDTRLAGALSLHARPGEALRASGAIETQEGVYDAYGQRLTIDEGKITFLGPLANPALNVTALRKGLSVEAGVQITGSAQKPRVKLVSSPNVPDVEKMSWIMLGRAPGSGSEADGALMMAAAGVLFGDTTGGITGQIASVFGVDQIRLAQSESKGLGRATTSQVAGSATGFATSSAASGGESVSQQVVVVGKRLSNDLYLSLEQGVQGTESLVRLSYALTQKIALVVRAGTEQALDLNYTVSFR